MGKKVPKDKRARGQQRVEQARSGICGKISIKYDRKGNEF